MDRATRSVDEPLGDHELDVAAEGRRLRQPGVCCHQGAAELLSQRDIRRVVSREIVPQSPTPCEQRPVRDAMQRRDDEVRKRQFGTASGQLAA